jgi:7-carboxy-7-deazaguanine synthase
LPCVFVRLTGCHLRCHYCDTEYAFHEGKRRSVDDVIAEVQRHDCKLVEVTGGEPLLQPNVHKLMSRLCDEGCTVLIETSGACDISTCDPRVIRIMDLKTPGSGEAPRNLWSNIDHLNQLDEVKFVLTDRADYEWMRDVLAKHRLHERVNAVLVSASAPMSPGVEIRGVEGLPLRDLAEWVLADRLPVRMQTQLHKLIWDPMTRGV